MSKILADVLGQDRPAIFKTGNPAAEEEIQFFAEYSEIVHVYASAAREIATKLENLNAEFCCRTERNPIHDIRTRVKMPRSIIDKLQRKDLPISFHSAEENLEDIAGIRVICPYIDDIYLVARLITSQYDIGLIRTDDYIKTPKESGYRCLHLIVTVPVFLSDSIRHVKAEIQIRTIAMDFWAELEYDINYKIPEGNAAALMDELRECAEVIARTDERMQKLHDAIARERSGGCPSPNAKR